MQLLKGEQSLANVINALGVCDLIVANEELFEALCLAPETFDSRQLVTLQPKDAKLFQFAQARDLLNLVIV